MSVVVYVKVHRRSYSNSKRVISKKIAVNGVIEAKKLVTSQFKTRIA